MKKAYVTPAVEKVEFQYDRVVAASGSCTNQWVNLGSSTVKCPQDEQEFVRNFND